MSLTEVVTHEYVHAITRGFLDDPDNFLEVKKVKELFDRSKETIEWTDFLPDTEDGRHTDYERAKAKKRYKYIYENSAGNQLHEFVAIALTNEAFAKALATKSTEGPISPDQDLKALNAWLSNPLQQIWNIFVKALNWLAGHSNKKKGANIHESLLNTIHDLVTLNTQEQNRIAERVDDSWANKAETINKNLKEKLIKAGKGLAAAAVRLRMRSTTTPEQRATLTSETIGPAFEMIKDLVKGDLKGETAQEIKGEIKSKLSSINRKVAKAVGIEESRIPDLLKNTTQEIVGLAKSDRLNWRNLKRLAETKIDTARKRITDTVTEQIADSFLGKVTEEEWKAINDIFLRGDISTLVGSFTETEILSFISDANALNKEIRKIQNTLQQEFGRNGMAYMKYARSMGSIVATGQPTEVNSTLNAYETAHMLFLGPEEAAKQRQGDLTRAEQLIDQLATLHALQYTDVTLKERAAAVMTREIKREGENGISNLLNMHNAFKEISLDKNFGGNKVGVIKGYTQESFNPNISIEYREATEDMEKKMKEKGFVLVNTLPRDPTHQKLVNNKTPMGMYVSKLGLSRYRAQVISLTNPQKRGTSILESLQDQNVMYSNDYNQNIINGMTARNNQAALKAFQKDVSTNPNNAPMLVPIFSPEDNRIVDYRYLMTEETKTNILGRNDLAHENLGRMFGNIQDKVESASINKEGVKLLKKEYDALSNDSTVKFRKIGINSTDPKDRDMWRMLPDKMKYHAREQFGGDYIMVREDLHNYILGFREVSAASYLQKLGLKYEKNIPHNVLISVRVAEDVWKEIVNFARVKGSILLPEVVFGNIFSNNLVLLADGIPPKYILNKTSEAIIAMREYQKDRYEKDRLDMDIVSKRLQGKDVKALEARSKFLENKLTTNPVHEMVEEGLYQSIVENVNPESFSLPQNAYIQRLVKKVTKPATENFEAADSIVNVGKEVMMMPGSKAFMLAMAANQYGDFVARYTKYKYDTEVRKKSKQDAIDESLDYFIYYNEPADPMMTAANDYGMFMFAKFFLRIQRVAFRLLKDKPATSALAVIIDKMTFNQGISDYFLNLEKAWQRFEVIPDERLGEAIGVPGLEWAKLLIPGWE
jgi:hypothetical protein